MAGFRAAFRPGQQQSTSSLAVTVVENSSTHEEQEPKSKRNRTSRAHVRPKGPAGFGICHDAHAAFSLALGRKRGGVSEADVIWTSSDPQRPCLTASNSSVTRTAARWAIYAATIYRPTMGAVTHVYLQISHTMDKPWNMRSSRDLWNC